MNVEQLRRVLADLPGDMPVVVEDSKLGWMQNAALYVAPAHIDHCVSGNYLHARHRDDGDNCDALLMSGFGQTEPSFVDITPQAVWTKVIDVESEVAHTSNPVVGQRPEASAQGHLYKTQESIRSGRRRS
jgi:hypothetical protein